MFLISLRRYGLIVLLLTVAWMSAAAFGAREGEHVETGVQAADGGAVEEGSDVVVVGRVAVVGSEPITHLIVRTDAPGEEGRWVLEITGDLADEVFDHQNQVLRLEGRLDRFPAGAERGRLAVRSFDTVYQ